MRGIIIRYKVSDVQGFNNFMENRNVESYIQDFTNKIYKEVYKKVSFWRSLSSMYESWIAFS